jgi:hypothetical protein
MKCRWTVAQLAALADQVSKRWKDNPESVRPSKSSRDGDIDYSWIHMDDINLAIRIVDHSDNIWISLKNYHSYVERPPFFNFTGRRTFDEAVRKLKQVCYEMENGPADLGEKLLCEAFPELFEKHIGLKDKK